LPLFSVVGIVVIVMKITFTSIFHPFFLTFSIPLPLRGGKLPTKRPYCSIPGHYGLLGLPSQHSLHSLFGITKTMMSIMTTGLASCWSFNMLPYTVQPSVAGLTKPSELPIIQSIPRLSLSGFSTVHTALPHCADCPLYSLVITQQVMCALFSTIALASLFITVVLTLGTFCAMQLYL